MRNLLALLLFVPSLCLAQLPNYVPTDGLVAWYPFNGNANDESGNGNDGSIDGDPGLLPSFVYDNVLNREVIQFDDIDDELTISAPGQLGFSNEFTFSCWLDPNEEDDGQVMSMDDGRFGFYSTADHFDALSSTAWASEAYYCGWNNHPFVHPEGWYQMTITISSDSIKTFGNGQFIVGLDCGGQSTFDTDIIFGYRNMYSSYDYHWGGHLADCGIWNRALTEAEVSILYSAAQSIPGCTEPTACNFEAGANTDDGSCVFGCLYCGDGTVWDDITSTCVVAYPSDVDLDGCTGIFDVLEVLANFGGCYPSDPEIWTCGDPITFWNYNYQTVLIGNACWMAENLQTDRFANGDYLPLNVDNATSYALGEEGEASAGFPGESVANQDVFGLMYNWYAVHDCRNLCPEGWHVSTQLDWSHLLSIHGPEYIAGNRAKASPTDTPGWDGSNLSGLSVIPAGGIFNGSSTSFYPGIYAYLHIAGLSEEPVSTYRMQTGYSNLFVSNNDWADLKSVRCVTDSDLSSSYCHGCTDPDACNYDSAANINDNSCNYDCYGCLDPNYIEYSPEILFDNGNCLHLIDDECQSFEWDDHQYGVVQIGGQCWLSENLKSSIYADGSEIPHLEGSSDWTSTSSGASCIYGAGDATCDSTWIPNGCNENYAEDLFGRLYNWFAVTDERGLCPSGWHVPSELEWDALEQYVSSQGYEGSEAFALKADSIWPNEGSGSNEFGFSGLPGGRRAHEGAYQAQDAGWWWTSSIEDSGESWMRYFIYYNNEIAVFHEPWNYGMSVRCLKD